MTANNSKTKIIIVDDNLLFRRVIGKFLVREYGYTIIGEAACGEEFFALPNIYDATIILMDLQMPEIDGYEITKKILRDYNHIKVIANTMHTEKAFLNELINVGFRGCVFKPEIYTHVYKAIEMVNQGKYYFPEVIKI
jgi:DNA-binding NarL/FixJ family response regulator